MKTIGRKRFLMTGAAVVAGVALGVGCAGDDDDTAPGDDDDGTNTPTPTGTPTATPTPTPMPTPSGNCAANGTIVTISNPHSHALVVSAADVNAGIQKTYDITGANVMHGHDVTLTAAHFTQLQMNSQVTVLSSANGHTHNVTVRCA